MALPLHQPVIKSMSLPMVTEIEPMDLSEKSTSTTSLVCPPSVAVAGLDQDGGGGSGIENQLHSPARSLSSSSGSRDGSDATSTVGTFSGVDHPHAARSQNQASNFHHHHLQVSLLRHIDYNYSIQYRHVYKQTYAKI